MSTLIGLIKLSFANLRINKLRSILTVIGMIFGTGAVIATLSSNEGASQFIKKELEMLGTNVVMVQSENPENPLLDEHVSLLKKYIDNFRMLTMVKEVNGFTLRRGTSVNSPRVVGVDAVFLNETKIALSSGRLYDDIENQSSDLVAVIGSSVKQELFGHYNAIGELIYISENKATFIVRVIGVLKARGANSGGPDFSVFMPYKTVEKIGAGLGGNAYISGTLLRDEESSLVRDAVKALLSKAFPQGLSVTDSREAVEKTQGIWRKQNLVGICLAMISLVTGGVGIMNIMLLSVAQRKREIGLRKAVGATNIYILMQFLIEAVMVCFCGGVVGILVGMFFGQQVAKMMGQWDAVLNVWTIVYALVSAMCTGIIFGLAPAMRASQLDPYEALRG